MLIPIRSSQFKRDHVWAATVDEQGVERVVRYRILRGGR